METAKDVIDKESQERNRICGFLPEREGSPNCF